MDDANMRKCAQDHAAAIERGDLAAATADFVAEMRAAVPELAKALPNPVEKAEVLSVDVGDDASVAQIRYTGTDGSAVTIRSHWREVEGQPQIFQGEPV
jgi:hypothetical protein